MANLFPMFLKLTGQRCLVVGAGQIAEQKIDALLASGAEVRVVAPEASESVRKLAASGRLTWAARRFDPADLDDVVLAIAATCDRAVNEEVFRSASNKRVLCNAVDEPEYCHFYYPAVVRRGDLQIAISTAGHSPALAQRLRRELETLIGPEYEDLLRWLGRVRGLFFKRNIDPQLRKNALHRIASRDVFERFVHARKRHQKETV
jgi:precorrin-2 dehydrogenase/sirohydrochlorin ferrochelatase